MRYIWRCFYVVTASILCIAHGSNAQKSCVTYNDVITSSILKSAVGYMNDNPSSVDNARVGFYHQFSDPTALFNTFKSGDESKSLPGFLKAIREITYAERTSDNANYIRNFLYQYMYGRTSSINGRSKMGNLLKLVGEKYGVGSTHWGTDECISAGVIDDLELAISIELTRLRQAIGDENFGSFLSLVEINSLGFVIDVSGSMDVEISVAKQLSTVIASFTATPSDENLNKYIVVPFSDPFRSFHNVSTSPDGFESALNRLTSQGGGDPPEYSLSGILLALEKSPPGSTLYVLTDIEAKDYPLQDIVVAKAHHKGTSINFLLTNQVDRICFYPYVRNYKTCKSLYEYISQGSEGMVITIGNRELQNAEALAESTIKKSTEIIKIEEFDSKRGLKELTFQVDPTVTQLIIDVGGNCGNAKVSYRKLTQNLDRIGSETQTTVIPVDGQFGEWTLEVDQYFGRPNRYRRIRRLCTARISAKSDFGFIASTVVDRGAGIQLLSGYSSPYDGETSYILELYGCQTFIADYAATARFLHEDGSDALHSTQIPMGMRCGDIRTISRRSVERLDRVDKDVLQKLRSDDLGFRIVLEGFVQGFPFTRVSPQISRTSYMTLKCEMGDTLIEAGLESMVKVTLTNYGTTDRFLIGISDEKDYVPARDRLKGSQRTQVTSVSTDDSETFYIPIRAPEDTDPGTPDTIIVTARGQVNGDFQYAVCGSHVVARKTKLDAFVITASIQSRYAHTELTKTVTNIASSVEELDVEMYFPSDAFVTSHNVLIGDKLYNAKVLKADKSKKMVEEDEEANVIETPSSLQDSVGSQMKIYTTKIKLLPKQSATVTLTFEEILKRKDGRYLYSNYLNPEQPVKKFHVNVRFIDSNTLKNVEVRELSKRHDVHVVQKHLSKDRKSSLVSYSPSLGDQLSVSSSGIFEPFTVEYTLDPSNTLYGDYTVADGHFAHFLSDDVLPPQRKVVVFAIDASESMYGHKMKQIKQAVADSLKQLVDGDLFNIILFGEDDIVMEEGRMIAVSEWNIEQATSLIGNFPLDGESHFISAVKTSLDLISDFTDDGSDSFDEYQKMVVLITDDDVKVNAKEKYALVKDIVERNDQLVTIHTVGMGLFADGNFLGKLSACNGGSSLHVSDSMDASEQIKSFLSAKLNVLLSDISVKYDKECVTSVTTQQFNELYKGEELIIAGKMKNGSQCQEMKSKITGRSGSNIIAIDFMMKLIPNRRISEYLHQVSDWGTRILGFSSIKSIQGILENNANLSRTDVDKLTSKSLQLAIKNNFLTPLTTLDISLPDPKGLRTKPKMEQYKAVLPREPFFQTFLRNPTVLSVNEEVPPRCDKCRIAGFWADPHVLIPLADDVNLCFTWDGRDGEIYNFLHDYNSSLTVNGVMRSFIFPDNRTGIYTSQLSILVPEKHLYLIIRCKDLTIHIGNTNFDLSYSGNFTFVRNDVRVHLTKTRPAETHIQFIFGEIHYEITAFYHTVPNLPNYLNFAMIKQPKHQAMDGIIGQFFKAKVEIGNTNNNSSIIQLNHHKGKVDLRRKPGPLTLGGGMLECWQAPANAPHLVHDQHSTYLLPDLLNTPIYIK